MEATATIKDFQKFIEAVYALPDDRLYSIWDLLVQQQRFTMRALKGIRKHDLEKLRLNILIGISWLAAIANRLHIDVEDALWKRFPALCSYCGQKPCSCKATRPEKRTGVKIDARLRPKTIQGFQQMFREIYPPEQRTLADAGVHLAEEMGEVGEAIHNYLGQHQQKWFDDIPLEIADFLSCVFGVANSARIDIADEFSKMFSDNCHVCHRAPCICSFSEVAQIRT